MSIAIMGSLQISDYEVEYAINFSTILLMTTVQL